MLFYERRKKKPIKVLVPKEEVESQPDKEQIHEDKDKEEFYRYVDYKDSIVKATPNSIFKDISN